MVFSPCAFPTVTCQHDFCEALCSSTLFFLSQAPELITTFDEHRVSPNFKFGVLCQKNRQVSLMLYFKMPCIFIKMAKIWHHIITNPSQRNPFLCSSLRKTYWVTMRKVRSLKSSCLFWERQFSCKDSRGKVS